MVVWYGVYYIEYTKKLYRHTDIQDFMYLHSSLLYHKGRVVKIKKKTAALFMSIALVMGAFPTGWALNTAVETTAAPNTESSLKTMEPVIQAYTNTVFYEAGKTQHISCKTGSDDKFWSILQAYAIFNMSNHAGSFSYTQDELKSAAYSLFSDFDGNLPDYPESFYSGTGFGASVNGTTVDFMPATPEEQELELLEYTENSDGSIEAVYYLSFYGNSGYHIKAEMSENSKGGPAYTLESLDYYE